MISYEEAIAIVQQQAAPLAPVSLPVAEAIGHVAAADVTSRVLVSPFDNSAMDGFALRSVEAANPPVTLPVTGSTVAGDVPADGAGGAWEIMTGAPVPEGYDTVVKIEDVTIQRSNDAGRPAEITLDAPVAADSNIRKAGEDFTPGDVVIAAGTRMGPYHLMALATVGEAHLSVYPKPRVGVISTGKEIVDDADAPLAPGQIRNSNSPYLMAALAEMGASPTYAGVIHDAPEVFEARVQAALPHSDVIISTGAVSAGRHDFIPDSLRALGAEILFHKVAIRPGKPILYARLPDGTHYFGLPGNPVSAAVGLRFFVVPLLRRLQGMADESPITARLLMPSPKKQGLRFFRKAYVSVAMGGKLQMEILRGQESFKIHPLLAANCWASFTEAQTGQEVGESIEIYPLVPGRWDVSNVS